MASQGQETAQKMQETTSCMVRGCGLRGQMFASPKALLSHVKHFHPGHFKPLRAAIAEARKQRCSQHAELTSPALALPLVLPLAAADSGKEGGTGVATAAPQPRRRWRRLRTDGGLVLGHDAVVEAKGEGTPICAQDDELEALPSTDAENLFGGRQASEAWASRSEPGSDPGHSRGARPPGGRRKPGSCADRYMHGA
mmetsp:Transcript_37636/g.90302  ORF Transcript_37636/g.90302 Transcript_37636/m.90302 type:complete len:197 (-) Transcript_37636:9-599(-)